MRPNGQLRSERWQPAACGTVYRTLSKNKEQTADRPKGYRRGKTLASGARRQAYGHSDGEEMRKKG